MSKEKNMSFKKVILSSVLVTVFPVASYAALGRVPHGNPQNVAAAKPVVEKAAAATRAEQAAPSKTAKKSDVKTKAKAKEKEDNQSDDDTFYLDEKESNTSPQPGAGLSNDASASEAMTPKLTAQQASQLKIPSQEERYTLRFRKMNQDLDNPIPMPQWLNKIKVGGLVHIDANNQTKPNFNGDHSNQVNVAAAKLNIQATVNKWIQAKLGLFYASNREYYYPAANSRNGIRVEDAYVDIYNFQYSPLYLRLGQQYLPFGRYHRYPITRTLTQQLSEIREPALQFGFVDVTGFYGSFFVLSGIPKVNHSSRTLSNGGATLGYENYKHPLGVNVGIDYLNNMADIGAIEYNLISSHYYERVGALSLHADIAAGPFSFGGRYVTALRNFSPSDFTYQRSFGITRGAKPNAALVSAGYQFKTLKRDSKVELSYQWTHEAYNVSTQTADPLKLPRTRISVSYGVNILKYTVLEFQYDRDHDYSTRHGGTNAFNNIATLRLTVLF